MKDYAMLIADLPSLDGSEPVEEELKDRFLDSSPADKP